MYIVLAFLVLIVIAIFYAFFYLNNQKERKNLLQISSHHEYDLNKAGLKISSLISYSKHDRYYRPRAVSRRIITSFKNYYKSTDAQKMQQLTLPALLNDNRHYIKIMLKSLLSFEDLYKLPYDRNSDMPVINKFCSTFIDACATDITQEKIKNFFAAAGKPHPLTHKEITLIIPIIKLELIKILDEILEIAADVIKSYDEAQEFVQKLSEIPFGSSLLDDMLLKQLKYSDDGFKVLVYKILMHQANSKDELITNYKKACRKISFDIDSAMQSHFIAMSEYAVLTNSIINSMKNIERIDEVKFQKLISPLEKILLLDPLDKYAQMTDLSKSVYRNKVEYTSGKIKVSQIDLVESALNLARQENKHIGEFFFHEEKIKQLYAFYNKKPPVKNKIKLIFYNTANVVLTILFTSALYLAGYFINGNHQAIIPAVLLLPFFYNAGDILLQKFVNKYLPKEIICQIEFKNSIPIEAKTLVLSTTLILKRTQIDEILTNLEMMYYSNKDKNINFGILADFTKSEIELTQNDKELHDYMKESIDKLNKKTKQDKFYFFVRRKIYNGYYDAFIANERKRGAVIDFNQFIIDGVSDKFMEQKLPDEVLNTKYIITLDEDTIIPPNEAFYMIGAMEHPLNRPYVEDGIVIRGHGVMQPEVRVKLKDAAISIFSKIYSGNRGYYRYSENASGHYMKLFKRGIYCGKGIYNPKVFNDTLASKLPYEKILSHDLLEGGILNAVNITPSIQEGFPSSINAYYKRKDRWLRGDIQLLPFFKKSIKNSDNQYIKINLSSIVKLQMIDNIIKAQVPAALMLSFIVSFFTESVEIFLFVVLFVPVMKVTINLISCLIKYNRMSADCLDNIIKLAVYIMYLPKEAYTAIKAHATSLYRMTITKKDLLKWTTAAAFDINKQGSLTEYSIELLPNLIFSIMLILSAVIINGGYLFAVIAAIIYIISIIIAKAQDRRIYHERCTLATDEIENLQNLLDETYLFFEDYADNKTGLICDNYQYFANKKKTERTSPTNIGFSLIAYLIALERNLIDIKGFYERIKKVIDTIESMKKWNGHLFNWYNTKNAKASAHEYVSTVDSGNLKVMLMIINNYIKSYLDTETLKPEFKKLYIRIKNIIDNMDFKILYDESKHLFSIGYDVDNDRYDVSHYDMYMSEARQIGLMEICLGNIGIEHFKALSRNLTYENGFTTMMSWGGSTFEYLMPALFFKHPYDSLLYDTLTSYIDIQNIYCKRMDIPVGISEGGYADYDLDMFYQYKSFGVPGTGIKNNLEKELLTSPYAAALMLPFDDRLAYNAIQDFIKLGAKGKYGLYEAIDFTPSRTDGKYEIIQSHMAHHQGMIMASVFNYLTDMKLVEIFSSIPEMRSSEILLSEPKPTGCCKKMKDIVLKNKDEKIRIKLHDNTAVYDLKENDNINAYHVLSNGNYHLQIDAYGNSTAKLDNIYVNRPYLGSDKDQEGIKSVIKIGHSIYDFSGKANKATKQKVKFGLGYAEFTTCYDSLELESKIFVSAKENLEIRRYNIKNDSLIDLDFDFYCFMEPALCTKAAYTAHRAYQGLFLNNNITDNTITFTRRKKRAEDISYSTAWKLISDSIEDDISFYNDRLKVIGRYKDYKNADIYNNEIKPSENVVDSIMCGSIKSRVKSHKQKTFYLITCMKKSEDDSSILINMNYDASYISYLSKLASAGTRAAARFYELSNEHFDFIEKILPLIISNELLTIDAKKAIGENSLNYTRLWRFALDSDMPIVSAYINDINDITRLQELIKINRYLCSTGTHFQLAVIYNTSDIYKNELFNQLCCLKSKYENLTGKHDCISIIKANDMSEDENTLLRSVSSASLNMDMPLIDQINISNNKTIKQKDYLTVNKKYSTPANDLLLFNNSYGGFDLKNNEYIINVDNQKPLPMPWSNIITNASFGAVLTENGISSLFVNNSRESKITHWYNDAITNKQTVGLSVYDSLNGYMLLDKNMSGQNNMRYNLRHGFGYSVFEIRIDSIDIINTIYISNIDDLLVQKIEIINKRNEKCELDINMDIDAILGSKDSRHVVSKGKDDLKILQNNFSKSFEGKKVFIALTNKIISLKNISCSYKKSTFNVHRKVEIDPSKKITFYGLIGSCRDEKKCLCIYNKYLDLEEGLQVLLDVKCAWKKLLSNITIKSPDAALNIMMNGCLNYQTYASRLMARTGYYQCGGAFGFRDQLQDALSILWTAPDDVRDMIVNFASHQFESGDVQHWWHTPRTGVRTKISDDMVFLVYLTVQYIEKSGDYSILNEEISYLVDVEIPEDIQDYYTTPDVTLYKKPLITHCINALNRSYAKGRHNLPLMGSGDWNDAMNNVGVNGLGESVWLGFFLFHVMQKFYDILHHEKKYTEAEELADSINSLEKALKESSWDGNWFIRAYFDDGTPLGSALSDECKIDVISQAWAIISGISTRKQAETASSNVDKYLFDRENQMLKLLWPAFDNWNKDAGYIKGYIPGVRENGAQYTHGAVWMAIAYCIMGDGNKAFELINALNPINHSKNINEANKYKVEPYVLAADIYAADGLKGRGGWTWYTGSASWMYKAILEYLLGFKKEGNKLFIKPCMPDIWDGFEINYLYKSTRYIIRVKNKSNLVSASSILTIDGKKTHEGYINLIDDMHEHNINILI